MPQVIEDETNIGMFHQETGNGAVAQFSAYRRVHSKNGWKLASSDLPAEVLFDLATSAGYSVDEDTPVDTLVKYLTGNVEEAQEDLSDAVVDAEVKVEEVAPTESATDKRKRERAEAEAAAKTEKKDGEV